MRVQCINTCVLLCVTDTLERHHQQAETDDEGIERDAGECDDEPSTSTHHITLTHIMEVRIVTQYAIHPFNFTNALSGSLNEKLNVYERNRQIFF